MSAHLLTSGIIHSVSDPYATALLVADGVVAWLGSDESADRVAGPEVDRTDLDGAVVAPGFVAPIGTAADAAGALGRGVTVQTVLAGWGGPAPESDLTAGPAAPAEGTPRARTVVYRAEGQADDAAAGVWLAVDGPDAASLTERLRAATAAGEQAYLVPSRPDLPAQEAAVGQATAIAALRAVAEADGLPALGRVRHRLLVTAPLEAEDRALLASAAVSVTVVPDADGVLRAPLGSLLADAVPVALGAAGQGEPWAPVRACLSHPEEGERISARSAFTAASRTGLRALPDVPAAALDAAPRLTVSAPATFAVWRADAVAVQSPDGRVAAWSTDTRAGTPLLPSLEADAALPVLEAVWVDGERVAAP